MNSPLSLEERVRAAVRATAAEIGPYDVPPLAFGANVLDARGDRSGRPVQRPRRPLRPQRPRRAGGGRRDGWRWAAPLAAAAAVVAVVGLAAGLASIGSGVARPANTSRPEATRSAQVPPPYPADLQAGLIGLFVPASGAQYSAGALFGGEYKAAEGKVFARCMARASFQVKTPTSASIARGNWDLTQFPDLNAIARAGTMPGDGLPGVKELTGSSAYQAAFKRCSATSDSLFSRTTNAGGRLAGPWIVTVTNIQGSAPVLATLPAVRACAARYGWPHDPYGPDRPINSFADFAGWVAGHLDGAVSRGASAAQTHALDQHWARIFVRCARPAVTVMEELQLAAQRTFLRDHQRELAALAATAREDFATAARLARLDRGG
jgi:hypothetical protein